MNKRLAAAPRSLPERENDSYACLEEIQRLTSCLHGLTWIGDGRHVVLHPGNNVTTDIEPQLTRPRRKNLQAPAVVDREFRADFAQAGTAGTVGAERKNSSETSRNVRLRLRQWSLNHDVAV